jgi:acyl-coenzyme A synthetase/AMP-(fatty) acid ligase
MTAALLLPLLARADLDTPFAWLDGQPVSGRRFLADVHAQAEMLPARAPVAILCANRYRFAVVFAAALARGSLSLFPPNAMRETLERLREMYPALVVASDGATYPFAIASAASPALATSVTPTAPVGPVGPAPPGGPAARAATAFPNLPAVPLVPLPGQGTTLFVGGVAPAASEMLRVGSSVAAACLLTSGTTGSPQPHVKRWGQLACNVRTAGERLAEIGVATGFAGLNIVATVPPQHSYGFESSVLPALLCGAAFDAARPFYPADIADALARLPRPRALVTTPFHLRTLLRACVDLPPVDMVLSATAPLSPQLAQECERRLGGELVEIYGCTEAGQVAARRAAQTDQWRTFGELRIRAQRSDPADPASERFFVEGGHVEEPTPLADVLLLEDAQRFHLVGRTHDVVHVAGRRMSLAHLDWHLNSLEGVHDGAFWVPREVPDGVVRTMAFVVAPGLSAAGLLAALRDRIEPAFLPRRIVFLEALPREGTGKLTWQALESLAGRHAGGGDA